MQPMDETDLSEVTIYEESHVRDWDSTTTKSLLQNKHLLRYGRILRLELFSIGGFFKTTAVYEGRNSAAACVSGLKATTEGSELMIW